MPTIRSQSGRNRYSGAPLPVNSQREVAFISQPRVLLVEDDADVREATTLLIQAMDYEVCAAANGVQALHMLHTMVQLPNLILLDLWMPVMDGQTFLAELQKDAHLAQVPVVVVSAVADQLDDDLDLKVEECLTKPVSYGELLRAITSNCSAHKHH